MHPPTPCNSYVQDYDETNSTTYQGLDLRTMTMSQLYTHFGLDAQTIDFIGHALALHRDDAYLDQPALPTVKKVKLYHDSITRYDGLTSPYIYPRYGLGELPQVRAPPTPHVHGARGCGWGEMAVVRALWPHACPRALRAGAARQLPRMLPRLPALQPTTAHRTPCGCARRRLRG